MLQVFTERFKALFLALPGAAFASGFLVVFIFHSYHGVRGINAEFFKIKYAHVGVLFLGSLVAIGYPTLAFCPLVARWARWALGRVFGRFFGIPRGGWPSSHSGALPVSPPPLVAVIGALATVTFALFILFAPPGSFRLPWIPLLLILTLVTPLFTRPFSRRLDAVCFRRSATAVRLATVAVQGWILWRTAAPFADILWEMFWPGGCFYVCFVSTMFVVGWLVSGGAPEIRPGSKTGPRALVLLAFMFFVSTWSFALAVYRFVPAQKGGGDFRDDRRVRLWFKENAKGIPDIIYGETPCHSRPLVIFEGTDISLLVLDPKEDIEAGNVPTVVEIARDNIAAVEYNVDP